MMEISHEVCHKIGIDPDLWRRSHFFSRYFPRATYPLYSYQYFLDRVIKPHEPFLQSFSREIYAKIILPYSSFMYDRFSNWGPEVLRSIVLPNGKILEVNAHTDSPLSIFSKICSAYGKSKEYKNFSLDISTFNQEKNKSSSEIIITSSPIEFYSLGLEKYVYEKESRVVLPYKSVLVDEPEHNKVKILENDLPDYALRMIFGSEFKVADSDRSEIIKYVYY